MNETKPARNYAVNTFTRWGRSTCSGNATLVYDGFAAGADYKESGGAANYLCLPKNPDWSNRTNTPSTYGKILGAEYETHNSVFDDLKEHDVPCAVCRVPRSNIIMVPGKNVCFDEYNVEYEGYLMSGRPTHQAASEYVCVDREPERTASSDVYNHNGKLFYFVRAVCGSLPCPPYQNTKELLCVVCSYSP